VGLDPFRVPSRRKCSIKPTLEDRIGFDIQVQGHHVLPCAAQPGVYPTRRRSNSSRTRWCPPRGIVGMRIRQSRRKSNCILRPVFTTDRTFPPRSAHATHTAAVYLRVILAGKMRLGVVAVPIGGGVRVCAAKHKLARMTNVTGTRMVTQSSSPPPPAMC
jgi:hypothetical protein